MNKDLYFNYLVVEKCFLVLVKAQSLDLALINEILKNNNLTKEGFLIYARKFYINYSDTEIVKNLQALLFSKTKTGLINNSNLRILADMYRMSSKELDSFLNNYINSLGYTEEYIKDYKKSMKCFYEFIEQTNKCNHAKIVLKYYKKYADNKEKELLKEFLIKCLEEVKDLKIDTNLEEYLKNKGLSLNAFYLLITNCLRNNEEALKEFAMLGKEYHDLSIRGYTLTEIARKVHKENNIVALLMNLYVEKILGNERIQKFRDKDIKINLKTKNLEEILRTKDKETIIKLFQAYDYCATDIQRYAYVVNALLPKEVQQKIERNLRQKYNYYHYYKAQERKKVNTTKKEVVVLEEDANINNIDFKKLALMIYEGTENGSFDYIDLFLNFPNINIYANLYNKGLNTWEKILIKNLFNKFKRATFINKDSILNSHIEVNSLKDENGMLIQGTGRYLTKEEIKDIIDFLEENNIPLYDIVFNVAVRRYQNKTLFKSTLQR